MVNCALWENGDGCMNILKRNSDYYVDGDGDGNHGNEVNRREVNMHAQVEETV